MFDKNRVEELVTFLQFEKELFIDMHFDLDEEEFDTTLNNFNDTIEVLQSILSRA